jgi:hypothetical protein
VYDPGAFGLVAVITQNSAFSASLKFTFDKVFYEKVSSVICHTTAVTDFFL